MKTGHSVTLYGWPAKQTIPLSVLARNQTKDFWTWNLAVSGSGKGTRKGVGWTKELRGSWRWDSREVSQQRSWRGTTDRCSWHRTPSEEDRVKRCQHSSCFVEFSLVTHASVSLHMHVVLHTPLLLWVNPKHCSCLFVCPSIFSGPLDRILVAVKKCALPPSATGRSPAKKEMVRRKLTCVGERGATLQFHTPLLYINLRGLFNAKAIIAEESFGSK